DGGAGADMIVGYDGFDIARYDESPAGVTIALLGPDRVFGHGGDATGDQLTGIEGLGGSAFADTLTGDSQVNDLEGGGGDAVLTGGAGSDTIDGGDGNDQAVFSGARDQYDVTFDASTGTYTVHDLRDGPLADGADQVRNVETFVFADGAVPAAAMFGNYPP